MVGVKQGMLMKLSGHSFLACAVTADASAPLPSASKRRSTPGWKDVLLVLDEAVLMLVDRSREGGGGGAGADRASRSGGGAAPAAPAAAAAPVSGCGVVLTAAPLHRVSVAVDPRKKTVLNVTVAWPHGSVGLATRAGRPKLGGGRAAGARSPPPPGAGGGGGGKGSSGGGDTWALALVFNSPGDCAKAWSHLDRYAQIAAARKLRAFMALIEAASC